MDILRGSQANFPMFCHHQKGEDCWTKGGSHLDSSMFWWWTNVGEWPKAILNKAAKRCNCMKQGNVTGVKSRVTQVSHLSIMNQCSAITRVEPRVTWVKSKLLDQDLCSLDQMKCPKPMDSKVTQVEENLTQARGMSRVSLVDKVTRVNIFITRVNVT